MEKRKVIKTIERSCRSGKILSARWTCDWGCMAGDIHNNTITYSYIHHHKISQNNITVTEYHKIIILLHTPTFIATEYQCMGDFDTFIHKVSTIFAVSRQIDGYLIAYLVTWKKSFFVSTSDQSWASLSNNQSPVLSPQFSQSQITKANTKSKYGKNRQKGYDGDDVDADMMKMLLIMLMRMLMMMMLMMMLMMMSRKNVSSLISGTQTSWHWSAASRSPKQNTSLIPAHIYTQQWKSFKKEDLPLDIT